MNIKNNPTTVDYNNVPTVIFAQPPVGMCGLTEEQAKQTYKNIEVFKSSFKPMKNVLSNREEKTIMKMIVNVDNQKVVGLHMCGTDAGEIMQGFAVALKMGATKEQFDSTIGIHPSSSEEFVTM